MQMQTLKFIKKIAPPYSIGSISTPGGPAYKVSTDWTRADYWGMIKSRAGAFRMHYSVAPGVYAVGEPTKDSDVFATANYKLTFDIVRRELRRLNAWILVLDTKSINVWCAAGKGTFGTDELVSQIKETRLEEVVGHRRIILPQLGAVGVSASAVQKQTGFRVSFGPVRAKEIPAYVRSGYTKTKEMSTAGFSMLDRLVLTPMEINPAMKKFPWFAAGVLLVFGLQPAGILYKQAWSGGLPFLLLGLISIFAGAFITPVLLPFIPFRSFAIKGWIVGMLATFFATQVFDMVDRQNTLMMLATYSFFPALSSYLALQFTGSTTFTGMTGVKKELKIGIPLYIGAAAISLVFVVVFKLKEWGLV
jgi:acetyl-CoA decarbonylase/synthase complex subunit gamma